MKIVALRAAHLDDLYAIYCQVTANVAHCRFAPSRAHFHATLTQPAQPATQIFVAEEQTTALGFAALLNHDEATISGLFVQDEAAGQALLDACLLQARARNVQQLLAFASNHNVCPVPSYNAGWDGLSDRMSLPSRLLARNGFSPYHRELHLACAAPLYPPTPTRATAPIKLIEQTAAENHHTLVAVIEDQEVGNCEYSTLADLSDDPDAARWGYIGGLYASPAFRRQGIARQLLTTALDHLYRQGCTGCWLTTAADNWEAQPLYLALGFEVVDSSASFRKTGMVA
ncbi:MAG: GNAT family N-acetyltransferase [Chloroflexi bacterium]|nr:GNAT family N-acetyltransferase [Chloroflexota bacterium]